MSKRYTEYVDSGVPWIGDVPAGWTTRPLWSMFERVKDVGHPDEQMLSVFRDYGVVAKDSRDNINKTAENRNIYQLVHPGWLVSNRMKAWQGSVGISGLRGIVSGHYICFAPRHDADSRYLNWLFRSPTYAAGYGLQSRGVRIGQAEIDNDLYRVMPVLLPPIEEQRAIADYLDRETERVDTLIEEQQRLIEMLRERRGSAISNAVARGLDESIALKDSGLAGAGPVPTHWEIMPLRYTISFQEGPGIMAADFRDKGVPLLRVSSVRSARSTLEGCNYLDPAEVDRRWSHFRVDLGDLLISASASMGTVSEVTEETAGSVPYTGIIRIKPGRMHKDFIRWFVVSGEFID